MSRTFRFDPSRHAYIDLETGAELPHITGMLERAGLVNDLYFTPESAERGTCVHEMTATYDLGALNVESCVSVHRGYLLAHVAAMKVLRPEFLAIEEPRVHPTYRFGGRPDRDVRLYGLRGTLEIKTAIPQRSHQIQTALQSILLAPGTGLTPEMFGRWCLYLKKDGKFRLEEHTRAADFVEAYRIIRLVCGEGVAA